MESTDIFCLLKVNKVDKGDFIAETWAIQPPRKVNKKKKKKSVTWSNLARLRFP